MLSVSLFAFLSFSSVRNLSFYFSNLLPTYFYNLLPFFLLLSVVLSLSFFTILSHFVSHYCYLSPLSIESVLYSLCLLPDPSLSNKHLSTNTAFLSYFFLSSPSLSISFNQDASAALFFKLYQSTSSFSCSCLFYNYCHFKMMTV